MAPRSESKPRAARPESAWKREAAGRYRASDGRFVLDQEGPGRWFLVDEGQTDELGLARTLGPFPTMDEARAEAARVRGRPASVSPLEQRIAAARIQESQREAPSRTSSATPAKPAEPPPPPPPTWLERLEPAESTRARRLINGLERLGFSDPERIVRADFETGRPAVARALLARRVRLAALEPWAAAGSANPMSDAPSEVRRAIARGREAGLTDEDLQLLASFVARVAVGATLRQLSELERDPDAPRPMPGWRFVEHDPGQPERERRIQLDRHDVEAADRSES